MNKELYLDGEWFIGGEIFLLGYAYSTKKHGFLYGSRLTKKNFLKLLSPGISIFFYGPDIGILEKHFNIRLRTRYLCINLLRVFRDHIRSTSYRLADIEKKFGIKRERVEYKKSIFDIYGDWMNPQIRKRVLQYNREDVINLVKLKKIVFRKYNIRKSYLSEIRLQ